MGQKATSHCREGVGSLYSGRKMGRMEDGRRGDWEEQLIPLLFTSPSLFCLCLQHRLRFSENRLKIIEIPATLD